MKKRPVVLLSIFGIIFLLILFVFLKLFVFKTNVARYASDTGEYELIINQIGETIPLYGPSNCELTLTKSRRKVCNTTVTVDTDGGTATPDYFFVEWYDEYALVIVKSVLGEDGDIQYRFFYNGETDKREYHNPCMDGVYYDESQTVCLIIKEDKATRIENGEDSYGSTRVKGKKYLWIYLNGELRTIYKFNEENNTLTDTDDNTNVFYKKKTKQE